ncbi:hypothetical protein GCM10009603_53160 [Nocardiopsis exhalans]
MAISVKTEPFAMIGGASGPIHRPKDVAPTWMRNSDRRSEGRSCRAKDIIAMSDIGIAISR